MSVAITNGQLRCPLEEKLVLGALMLDNQCAAEVLGILQPEDFLMEGNREIFEVICTMVRAAETVDPVAVLEKMKVLDCCYEDSLDYILHLVDITPIDAEAVTCASKLRSRAERRRAIAEQFRKELRNDTMLKEITKDAIIPVGEPDTQMLEALLSQEEDEPLPFEERDHE